MDWRKNQQWESWFSRVSAGRQLLAVHSTTEKKNKREINSAEVEFDRKHARMPAIAHLSLAASRSPYQEPGHGCAITTQKWNRDYQSIKQKTQQKARCKERVKANNEAVFLVLTVTGPDTLNCCHVLHSWHRVHGTTCRQTREETAGVYWKPFPTFGKKAGQRRLIKNFTDLFED